MPAKELMPGTRAALQGSMDPARPLAQLHPGRLPDNGWTNHYLC